jgi:hypothetical protein
MLNEDSIPGDATWPRVSTMAEVKGAAGAFATSMEAGGAFSDGA